MNDYFKFNLELLKKDFFCMVIQEALEDTNKFEQDMCSKGKNIEF